MDLAALVPAESPASVADFATATETPQTDEAMAAAASEKVAVSNTSPSKATDHTSGGNG